MLRRAGLGFAVVALLWLGVAPCAQAQTSGPACGERVPFWKRVTQSPEHAYCRLLAQANAKLWSQPKESLRLAEEAARLRPVATRADVLRAHALLLIGEPIKAHEVFSQAIPKMTDPRAAGLSPVHVLGGARAALMTGEYQRALERYRWVLLRLEDFHHSQIEARVLIEAATAASYASPSNGRESRAYLASAVRKNAPLLRPIARAAWVLSLWRDGLEKRARAHAEPFDDSWSLLWLFEERSRSNGHPNHLLPVLPAGEEFAMAWAIATAIEPPAAPMHLKSFEDSAGELPAHLKSK